MACPVCGKPTTVEHRPFCSRRCADLDLARWLRGDYVIPGPALEDEEGPPEDRGPDDGEDRNG